MTHTQQRARTVLGNVHSHNFSMPWQIKQAYKQDMEQIPKICAYNLLKQMDLDMDDRISLEEMMDYIYKQNLQMIITPEITQLMFQDISDKRPIVHESQRYLGINLDEIMQAIRGRYSYDSSTQSFEVAYKPYRKYWVMLMERANDGVTFTKNKGMNLAPFSSTMPIVANTEKPIPSKPVSYTKYFHKNKISVSDPPTKPSLKESNPHEASIQTEQFKKIRVIDNSPAVQKKFNPYEQAVNTKTRAFGKTCPKISFESQEYYNVSKQLSQSPQTWEDDKDNPIFQYIPEKMRIPKTSIDFMKYTLPDIKSTGKLGQKALEFAKTHHPFGEACKSPFYSASKTSLGMHHKNTSLASPKSEIMDLQGRGCQTPQPSKPSGLSKKNLFQTTFKIEDCFETKAKLAKKDPVIDQFSDPSDHKFRDEFVSIGKPEFKLRFKCSAPYNPLGISEHDRRPKFALMREQREREKAEEDRKKIYEELFTGKKQVKKDWQQYFTLSDKLQQIGTIRQHDFLPKEGYIEPRDLLAQQMRNEPDLSHKELFRLYFKPLKSDDLNIELSGAKKPLKILY